MPSIEALDMLQKGSKEWNNYIKNTNSLVDLTFSNLKELDLKGRHFYKCDLSGVSIEDTDLDNSIFEETIIEGANIKNTSLVKCKFSNTKAMQITFVNTIIRDTNISKSTFWNLNFSRFILENCEINNCNFKEFRFEHSKLLGNNFIDNYISHFYFENVDVYESVYKDCKLNEWNLKEAKIKDCSFNYSQIVDVSFENSNFIKSEFIYSDIRKLVFSNTLTTLLDFSRSTLKNIDVSSIDPSTAVLLGTSFINCVWPDMNGKTTLFGKYVPSKNLLFQPIQDVIGVSPILRRNIADAQYLVTKIENAKNYFTKFLFRLWGVTSEFGQSLLRLTICSCLAIIIHALLILAIRNQLFGYHLPNFKLFYGELQEMMDFFLGSNNIKKNTNDLEMIIVMSCKVCGYLSLGLWIAIASSKFNKLSS